MVLSAPTEVTVRNQTGVWTLNRELSDPTDEIMKLQKIGWVLRKAIGFSSLTVKTVQWVDEAGLTMLSLTTSTTGGFGSEEVWQVDGVERDNASKLFGQLRARLRYITIEEIQNEYQKEGWNADCTEVLESVLTSERNGWTANSVSGYVTIDGIKRNARRMVIRSGDEVRQARLVYDYVGPIPSHQ